MRKLIFGLCLLAIFCGVGRADVAIVGPDKIGPGFEVVLRLTGTPSIDLAEPLIDQLGWLTGDRRMAAYLVAPGEDLQALEVRAELVFSAQGAILQPLIRFTPTGCGEYRLVVDWNESPPALIEHRMQAGDLPSPNPPPPPPPPPGPVEELTVLIIEELGQRTPEAEDVIRDRAWCQWLEDHGHKWRLATKTGMQDEHGNVPVDIAPWIARADTLPVVFFLDGDRLLRKCDLPATTAALLKLIKQYGVEK